MNYPILEWVEYSTPARQELVKHTSRSFWIDTGMRVRRKIGLAGRPWGVLIGDEWVDGEFATVDEAKRFAEATYELSVL